MYHHGKRKIELASSFRHTFFQSSFLFLSLARTLRLNGYGHSHLALATLAKVHHSNIVTVLTLTFFIVLGIIMGFPTTLSMNLVCLPFGSSLIKLTLQ